MNKKYIAVPGRLESVATDGQIAGANQVYDDIAQTKQEVLNEAIRDKEYAPTSFSGLGRKFLRKNISDNKNILTQDMMNTPNTIYHIQYDYDLDGQTITVPKGCVLKFIGGQLGNGTIVGDSTLLDCGDGVFDDITISGSWNVPSVSNTFFKNYEDDDVLKEVVKLLSPDIHNDLVIIGDNYLNAVTEWLNVLEIPANTDVFIDGKIELRPNNYQGYRVISLVGDNISLKGGKIVGDSVGHTFVEGSTSEWGHGLRIYGDNCSVDGVEIYNCIGDGISVAGKNVTITNIKIHDCRRQGVTLGLVDNIVIDNFVISDIRGTAPQSAIDIEPDEPETPYVIHNILIANGIISGCVDGIDSYLKTDEQDNRTYNFLRIVNVTISENTHYGMQLIGFDNVNIENCRVVSSGDCIYYRNKLDADNSNGCNISDSIITHEGQSNDLQAINNYRGSFRIVNSVINSTTNAIRSGHYLHIVRSEIDAPTLFRLFSQDATIITSIFDGCRMNITTARFAVPSNISNCKITCDTLNFTNSALKSELSNNEIIGTGNMASWFITAQQTLFVYNNRINIPDNKYSFGFAGAGKGLFIGNSFFGTFTSKRFNLSSGQLVINDGVQLLGTSDKRPSNQDVSSGFCYFDEGVNKPLWLKGSSWVEFDGVVEGVKRVGLFSQRPISDKIYCGFRYFATDLNKEIVFGRRTIIGSSSNLGKTGVSSYFANTLTQGTTVLFLVSQGGASDTQILHFTPTDQSLDGGISIPLSNKGLSSGSYYNYESDVFSAPDPAQYPYFCVEITSHSTSFKFGGFYNIGWGDANGFIAGWNNVGSTAKRPSATDVGAGFTYFDTNLGKMIVSNGTNWVNIDGTPLN